jgi:band 7 protein
LLLIEKLPELVKTQVEAVKNIKIDKITVWDSGKGEDGNNSTANFVSGMMKTVPPLNDLFNMAGLNLPTYLAKEGKQITNDEGRITNDEGRIANDEKQKTNNA